MAKKAEKSAKPQEQVSWEELLEEAIADPSHIAKAARMFKRSGKPYSLLNRYMASWCLRKAGLELQPISTFKGWQQKGRTVTKGEHASVAMVSPFPVFRTVTDEAGNETKEIAFMRYGLARKWFALSQTGETEGLTDEERAELDKVSLEDEGESFVWDLAKLCTNQGVCELQYEYSGVEDFRPGYALSATFAVNPMVPADLHALRAMQQIAYISTGEQSRRAGKEEDPETLRVAIAALATYLTAATLEMQGITEAKEDFQAAVSKLKEKLPDSAISYAFERADKLVFGGM